MVAPGVTFHPGRLLGVVAPGTALVIDAPADWSLLGPLWQAVIGGESIEEILDVLLREGLRAVPPFVLARAEPGAVRLVVRGALPVVVHTRAAVLPLDASGAGTWMERLVQDVGHLEIGDVRPPEDVPEGEAYRVATGVVLVGGLTFSCLPRPLPARSTQAPVPAAVDSAPVPPASSPGLVGAAPVAPAVSDAVTDGPPDPPAVAPVAWSTAMPIAEPPVTELPVAPVSEAPVTALTEPEVSAPEVPPTPEVSGPSAPPVAPGFAGPPDPAPAGPFAARVSPSAAPAGPESPNPRPRGIAAAFRNRSAGRGRQREAAESSFALPGESAERQMPTPPAPGPLLPWISEPADTRGPSPSRSLRPSTDGQAGEAPPVPQTEHTEIDLREPPTSREVDLSSAPEPARSWHGNRPSPLWSTGGMDVIVDRILGPAGSTAPAGASTAGSTIGSFAEHSHEQSATPGAAESARSGPASAASASESSDVESSPASTADPEPFESQAFVSETSAPETSDSEVSDSETSDSETSDSEVSESEPSDSDVSDSEMSHAGKSESEVSDSATSGTATSEADASGSASVEPVEDVEQRTAQPDVTNEETVTAEDDVAAVEQVEPEVDSSIVRARWADALPYDTERPWAGGAPRWTPDPLPAARVSATPAVAVTPGAAAARHPRVPDAADERFEAESEGHDAPIPAKRSAEPVARLVPPLPVGAGHGHGDSATGEVARLLPPSIGGVTPSPSGFPGPPLAPPSFGPPPAPSRAVAAPAPRGAVAGSATDAPEGPTSAKAEPAAAVVEAPLAADHGDSAAAGSDAGPGDSDPDRVMGVICPSGHANPPTVMSCRRCGSPITAQEATPVSRPVLGVLRFTGGQRLRLDHSLVLGRDPRPVSSNPDAELVAVPSTTGQVSRTHAEVRISGWEVVVTDLGATNGTRVTLPGTEPLVLDAGEPKTIVPGALVELGGEVQFVYSVDP